MMSFQPPWLSLAKFLCWLKKRAEIRQILCVCCLELKYLQLGLSHCSSVRVASEGSPVHTLFGELSEMSTGDGVESSRGRG